MGEERRQFRRVPEAFNAKCRPKGQLREPWKSVQTLNLSAGGMRFVGEVIVDPDMEVEIQLALPTGEEVFSIPAVVVWAKGAGAGLVEVGVQFHGMDDEQQFQIDQLVSFLSKEK